MCLTEILSPSGQQEGEIRPQMIKNLPDLPFVESFIPHKPGRVKPELRFTIRRTHMNVRRFVVLIRVEKETVGTDA